jgi:hypothetical protein
MGFLQKILSFFGDRYKSLTDEGKRKLVLVGTACFAAVLVLSVLLSLDRPAKKDRLAAPDRQDYRIVIPAEEIFLPDEPDFLPGVLLGREQRTEWTQEDAQEYWQDPLKFGEEQWREKIEAAIDEYLERVP